MNNLKLITEDKNYLFLVDLDKNTEDYIYEWDGCEIVAYRKKTEVGLDLALPLLPELSKQEEEVEKLANNYTNQDGWSNLPHREEKMNAFKAGYKAASKKYSKEDMFKMWEMAVEDIPYEEALGYLYPTLTLIGFEPDWTFKGEENACKEKCESGGCHSIAECKYVDENEVNLKIVNEVLQGRYIYANTNSILLEAK